MSFSAVGDTPKAKNGGKISEETKESSSDSIGINPIFNFEPSFISGLHGISPEDLGASVPFIDLKLVKKDGQISSDLNLSFFHQTVDLDELSSGVRFSDRPKMSLKDIQIRTSLASGYLFYTEVIINIRIHSPESLSNGPLLAFLIPGAPALLSYGWNSPNTELNKAKETLLLSVSTYDLTIDKTGQIDLSVKGFAYNEHFNNTVIGDGDFPIKTEHFDGKDFIFKTREELEELSDYIDSLKDSTKKGTKNYDILRNMAVRLDTREEVMRGEIAKRFKEKKVALLGKNSKLLGTDLTGKGVKKIQTIKLHDLVYGLANETLQDLVKIMPGVEDIRFVYGRFNKNAGILKNRSIADFPIQVNEFNNILSKEFTKGQYVITIKHFLNFLNREFLENRQMWNNLLSKGEEFLDPNMLITVTAKKTKIEGKEKGILEVLFVDMRHGIPVTTSLMAKGTAPESKLEDAIRKEGVPIIKLGHANSFIKEINISQIIDRYMKAALIERMNRNRVESVRSTKVRSSSLTSKPTNPLILPLQGSAKVLGHPAWKPFRAFFLSTGLYIVDAVYKITNVTHTLSQQGYDTTIDFIYH